MEKTKEAQRVYHPGMSVRLCHWGFVLFGLLSFLTGELAEDYQSAIPYGYFLHSIFGISLAVVILLYILNFFFGKQKRQYKTWIRFDKNKRHQIKSDIKHLMRFRLPPSEKHNGLAETIQILGILSYASMSVTGILIFLFIGFINPESHILKSIFNFHELFKGMSLFYLLIHVSASMLHTIAGHHVLGNIFSLRKSQ